MNKLELIQALKDATDLTKPEAAAVVDIFLVECLRHWRREDGSKSGVSVLSLLRSTDHIPGATPKRANGSRLLRRSCPFLKRVRN